jgi:hypothetical protein
MVPWSMGAVCGEGFGREGTGDWLEGRGFLFLGWPEAGIKAGAGHVLP